MSIFNSIKEIFYGEKMRVEPLDLKKAFQLQQVGVTGRAEAPPVNRERLDFHSTRNELVFACIEKKKQAAIDPTPIIEKSVDDDWQPIAGHPLSRLLSRPNPMEDGATFWGNWLASEDVFGEAYAEIERNSLGQPARLWRLNPLCIKPIPGKAKDGGLVKAYEYNIAGYVVTLPAKDVLVRRKASLTNAYWGVSPLQVAMGAVDMDTAQTDFVRAFFNNGGVPSGILKYMDGQLTTEQAEHARQLFMSKYGRGGRGAGGVAVLDERLEYQKVGATLSELESDSLRCQSESRICSVFGVPPILVGAYVGILHVNQRASVAEAQNDFWINTMSPLFKALRTFLTWNLLPEFADIALIEAEQIRVDWDMSRVMALQEDTDKRHDRARKDFQAGGITLNEFRAMIGEQPDEANGDYYLRPTMTMPVTPEVALIEAEKVPAEPKQLPAAPAADEKAQIISGLRKSLSEQVQKEKDQFGDLSLLSLVPPPKVYGELMKFYSEEEANTIVADVVAEIQNER